MQMLELVKAGEIDVILFIGCNNPRTGGIIALFRSDYRDCPGIVSLAALGVVSAGGGFLPKIPNVWDFDCFLSKPVLS